MIRALFLATLFAFVTPFAAPVALAGEEPELPSGLGGEEESPALPEGLGEETAEPSEEEVPSEAPRSWLDALHDLGLRGFFEARVGRRLQEDPIERDSTLTEARLQIGWVEDIGDFRFDLVADFLADGVADDHGVRLEHGEGWLDLRQASVSVSATDFMDVKVGRQVLTWGTGDLLFLNDLFPKDWQSFFLGRDTEYLKAPSDAVKIGIFTDVLDADLVYTPRFDADRHITGERLSFFNPALGRRSGRSEKIRADRPDDPLTDDELAVRLYRQVGSFEVAIYGYHGFSKSPAGMDPVTGKATFPKLRVYGASFRGPLAGGILSAEFAWYDSVVDRDGDDPFVPNGQTRWLLGFERNVPELANDLTLGVQWYVEDMLDHGAYRRSLPPGAIAKDTAWHVLTLRVTKQLLAQTLDLSGFAFVSPSDSDGYVRLNADYQVDDHWSAFVGLNLFFGDEEHTFFGQFEKNTNLFLGVRWSF